MNSIHLHNTEVDPLDTSILRAGAENLEVRLTEDQVNQFTSYYRELVDWGRKINLTSITAWVDVQSRLFLDSLAVRLAIPTDLAVSPRCVDVGSGAGFPGMALKIAFPQFEMTLVEATRKKTIFLEHVVQTLGLDGVRIVHGRAEDVAQDKEMRETFDLVFARAVADLAPLAELTLPLCKIGGRVIASKSADVDQELKNATYAVELMGGEIGEVIPVEIDGTRAGTSLVVLHKSKPTPQRYPRRPGMPAKHPLRA